MNFVIGAFYDGVYLLGMALNDTLSEGGDIRDGLAITRRMWDRNFHGKQLEKRHTNTFHPFHPGPLICKGADGDFL